MSGFDNNGDWEDDKPMTEQDKKAIEVLEETNPWIYVRRQWNDWRVGKVRFNDLQGFHWDWCSGGVMAPAPQPFIHAYTSCDCINGEIAHSCAHGEGPHDIKVCVVKKDNKPSTFELIKSIVGPKPERRTVLKKGERPMARRKSGLAK